MKMRIISLLLIFAMTLALLPAATAGAATVYNSTTMAAALASAKAKEPNGYVQGPYNGGIQCFAFADWLYFYLFGVHHTTTGNQHRNASDLYIGDYARIRMSDKYDHSIIITNIVGDTIYYSDANANLDNKVQWDRSMSRSTLQTKLNTKLLWWNLPNYGSQYSKDGYGYIKHEPTNYVRSLAAQTAPTAPTSVSLAPSGIAVGKTVKASWSGASGTIDNYIVNVINTQGNTVANTATVGGKTTSVDISIPTVGTYKISVAAKNSVGANARDSTATVVVHAPVTVMYYDEDGTTVVDKKTVDWNSTIDRLAVKQPSKEHYDFNGWVTMNNVVSDSSQTASYTIKTYYVTFQDQTGARIGAVQPVTALQAATAPAPQGIPNGYKFAGWDSDISEVKSNMTVKQVIAWDNPSFLTAVSIDSAVWNEEQGGYDLAVRIKGHPELNARGKIIASLKTDESSGRAEKMVSGSVVNFQKPAQPNSADANDTVYQVFVPYRGIVTKAEVEVVGLLEDGNTGVSDNTGAPIAAKTSKTIDLGDQWSDWQLEVPETAPARIIDGPQVRYRTREKSTTTSTSSTLSGWTQYNSTWVWGPWSSWVRTDPGGATDESQSRQKSSPKVVVDATKTQWRYSRYVNSARTFTAPYYQSITPIQEITPWLDSALSWKENNVGGTGYARYGTYTGAFSSYISDYWYNPQTQTVTTSTHNEWQYRDRQYTYYYEKWNDWSDWVYGDTAPAATDTKDVEVQTVYRYKDNNSAQTFYNYKRYKYQNMSTGAFQYTYDPTFVTSLGYPGEWEYFRTPDTELPYTTLEGVKYYQTSDNGYWFAADINSLGDRTSYSDEETREDVFGTERTVQGVLTGFGNKKATVMVYKGQNTDPTASQLQYIDQIELGENGEYSFTFRPKEEPSRDTGDFYVVIGVEGGIAPMVVDVIPAPLPVYEVLFQNDDGTEYAKQMVFKGQTAELPAPPQKEGYTFTGWNQSTTNVQSDMVLQAEYTRNTYQVVFIDRDMNFLETAEFSYGDTLIYPDELQEDGGTLVGWTDGDGNEVNTVTQNMIVTAKVELDKHTITFHNWDGTVISEQEIEYGGSAEIPDTEIEPMGDKVFAYWSDYASFVTADADIYPIMINENFTEMPVTSVPGGTYSGAQTVALTCSTPGASIYYTTDGTMPEYSEESGLTNGKLYTGPLSITKDTELMSTAAADGMNPSFLAYSAYIIDSQAAENTPQARVKSVEGRAGEFVDVAVDLSNNPGLASFRFQLHFDKTKLEPVSLTKGDALTKGSITSNVNVADIDYVTAFWSDADGIEDNGTLFTVRFKIKDGVEDGAIPLSLVAVEAWDEDVQSVDLATTDGQVTVYSFIPGDLDGNNVVNGADAIYLARYFAEWPGYELTGAQLQAADVNGDGIVNGADAIYLARYFAEWPDYSVLGKSM